MCDSISFIAWLDDMTHAEYQQGHYPFREANDPDHSWIEFRSFYPLSPLTGARFVITPVGVNDAKHGRIAGYQVEINPPACAIGHNRLLVNGVPAGVRVGFWLLKYWLAVNGCTQQGLDRITFEGVRLKKSTLTFLYLFPSEELARQALLEFRLHSEGLLNEKLSAWTSNTKQVAYSYPPGPPDAGNTYTSYIKMREFKVSAYVKEANVEKAFLKPLADEVLEARVADESARTLRIEVETHEKWLKDNELDKALQWCDNPDAYAMVFNLLRETLRLDEINRDLRVKRLKKTTVPKLKLSAKDKKYLMHHLNGYNVRNHPDFRAMEAGKQRNTNLSACKRRILAASGVDITIPYAVQSRLLSSNLANLLVFNGEFKAAKEIEPHISSRVSIPLVVERLKALVAEAVANYVRPANQDESAADDLDYYPPPSDDDEDYGLPIRGDSPLSQWPII